MSTTYYIRQKAGIGTISLRYRKGKSTNIIIATPFKIEVEKWDPINECYDESLKRKNPKNSSHVTSFTFENSAAEYAPL